MKRYLYINSIVIKSFNILIIIFIYNINLNLYLYYFKMLNNTKKILITGTNRGLGKDLVKLFM